MEYYYDGAWRSLVELHDTYGITLFPTIPITVYTEDLEELHGWEYINEDEPSESEAWICEDSRWYPLYPDELPYYRRTGNTKDLYLIGQLISFDEYSKQGSIMYPYESHLNSQLWLHDHYGITETPSQVYYVKNSVVKCWYNPEENQYFDVETVRWYPTPPSYEDSPIDANDINKIGAMGLFLFNTESGRSVEYGTLVSASQLQPMSMNFPNSGEFNYTKVNTRQITGSWRLLSAVTKSNKNEPSIVLAIKVSESSTTPIRGIQNNNTEGGNTSTNHNYIETIEYNL